MEASIIRHVSRRTTPSPPPDGATAGLALRAAAEGTLLPVRVIPRAARAGLDGVVEGALRVRLTAPPVEGAANAALLDLLADRLGRPKSSLAIATGATSRHKTVLVRGLAPDEVRDRLMRDA